MAILPALPALFFCCGRVWEGHAGVCIKLCPGKDRPERFPKVCLLIIRDSDVRTVFSVWVSFSVSQIVPLHIPFRWLVLGYRRVAFYTSVLMSLDLFALASASSIGTKARCQAKQEDLGPRIRRVRGVRLLMLDSCISKYLQIFSLAIFEYIPFWSQV